MTTRTDYYLPLAVAQWIRADASGFLPPCMSLMESETCEQCWQVKGYVLSQDKWRGRRLCDDCFEFVTITPNTKASPHRIRVQLDMIIGQ